MPGNFNISCKRCRLFQNWVSLIECYSSKSLYSMGGNSFFLPSQVWRFPGMLFVSKIQDKVRSSVPSWIFIETSVTLDSDIFEFENFELSISKLRLKFMKYFFLFLNKSKFRNSSKEGGWCEISETRILLTGELAS